MHDYLVYTSLLGNNIPILPVTTCATWYTCQSLNIYVIYV